MSDVEVFYLQQTRDGQFPYTATCPHGDPIQGDTPGGFFCQDAETTNGKRATGSVHAILPATFLPAPRLQSRS